MKKIFKAVPFVLIISAMLFYIGFIMYKSEPVFIDHPDNVLGYKPNKYDLLAINDNYGGVKLAMVIQMDTTSFQNHYALVKVLDWRSEYAKVQIHTITPLYQVVGKGTFYHRVNAWVGFNLMLVSTIFLVILSTILSVYLHRKLYGY